MSTEKGNLMYYDRILHNADMKADKKYSAEKLRQHLFFIDAAKRNLDDFIRKGMATEEYDDQVTDIIGDRQLRLIALMNHLSDNSGGIRIHATDSMQNRLAATRMTDQLSTSEFTLDMLPRIKFTDNQLYFLSCVGSRYLLTTILKGSWLFNTISDSGRLPNKKIVSRIEWTLFHYLTEEYGETVSFTVVNEREKNVPALVMMNGSTRMGSVLIHALSVHDTIFTTGAILSTDDIGLAIDDVAGDKEVNHYNKKPATFSVSDLDDHDVLIEYPRDTFMDFLSAIAYMATEPKMKEIYLSIYRIGDNPQLIDILARAVKNGKKVFVNVETEAPGDERLNRFWSRELTRLGVTVTEFSETPDGVRVHCKYLLGYASDKNMISVITTGNFHTETVTCYTDLCYFTRDTRIGKAIRKLARYFMEKSEKRKPLEFSDDFICTTFNAREVLRKLFVDQIGLGEAGKIRIKCNALTDPVIEKALDIAAEQGCEIVLMVRGACSWEPTLSQLGDNVTVLSTVGRNLEHSRVYQFGPDDDPIIYIGSLDLVESKIDDRIETMVRVTDKTVVGELIDYLDRYTNMRKFTYDMVVYKESNLYFPLWMYDKDRNDNDVPLEDNDDDDEQALLIGELDNETDTDEDTEDDDEEDWDEDDDEDDEDEDEDETIYENVDEEMVLNLMKYLKGEPSAFDDIDDDNDDDDTDEEDDEDEDEDEEDDDE